MHKRVIIALTLAGLEFKHEVALSEKDRIDFIVGTVGIEIKNRGNAPTVLRQLHRYAKDAGITALVLLTTRAAHLKIPRTMLGKPVEIILLENWA